MTPNPLSGSLQNVVNASAISPGTFVAHENSEGHNNDGEEVSENSVQHSLNYDKELHSKNAEFENNTQPTRKAIKRKQPTEDNEFLEIEKEKMLILKGNSEIKMDADYNFLLSFLPFMKTMTDIQKVEFRLKMSEWLAETVTRNKTPTTPLSWTANSTMSDATSAFQQKDNVIELRQEGDHIYSFSNSSFNYE